MTTTDLATAKAACDAAEAAFDAACREHKAAMAAHKRSRTPSNAKKVVAAAKAHLRATAAFRAAQEELARAAVREIAANKPAKAAKPTQLTFSL